MHTLLLLPTSLCNLQPKKLKGDVFFPHTHTQNGLTSHQPGEGLISAEVTAAVSPSNSEDHAVLTLTFSTPAPPPNSPSSSLSHHPSAHNCSLSPVFLSSSVSYPSSCYPPPVLPPSTSFLSLLSVLSTAPLCAAPVLPHSRGGITRQNAGRGEGREVK